jgi:tRNA pseudouridine38-40 synthase
MVITLEYDGSGFQGWQLQARGRTVQGVLEQAVKRSTTAFSRVIGASRTDAGVHALGQVAHFDTCTRLDARQLMGALNHWLPRDVAVLDCRPAPSGFHAQFDPSRKLYRYRILRGGVRHPLREDCVLRESRELDLGAMRRCAAMILGEHDFTSVCSAGSSANDHVRTVLRSELLDQGDEVHYMVEAGGFLYNMVRILVGTMIQVGLGKMTPGEFALALGARDRTAAGPTAAARGLTLVRIAYENDPRTGWSADSADLR